jgi:hypothetical protein
MDVIKVQNVTIKEVRTKTRKYRNKPCVSAPRNSKRAQGSVCKIYYGKFKVVFD